MPNIEESKRNRSVSISNKRKFEAKVPQTSNNATDLNFKENIVKVYMQDIPALLEEPYTSNIGNYRSKIAFEYAFYRGPDLAVKSYATTWEKVTENIYRNEDFGGQLNKNNYYEADLDRLLVNATSDKETIQLIFDFVKSKVKWNDYIGYTSENGVKKAYKEGVGNIADINLMLISMLRHAKINANPVLISTGNNGIPLFPTQSGFNYVICAVQLDQSILLLDASHENAKENILPKRVLNWQGRLIREDGTSDWINLNPESPSQEMIMLNYVLDSEWNIEGKIHKRLTEYLALDYRDENKGATSETQIRKLEENKGNIEILNIELKDENNINKPIVYNYDFKLKNGVDEIGGKLYLSPLLFLNKEENPFKQDSRLYPIDFIYPIANKYIVNIELPDGYAVESMPENIKVELNVYDGKFSYLIRENENNLQLTVEFVLNKTFVLPSEYNQFKEFFALSFEKQSEQIVLARKQQN
ncbi:DUF3858 domain-containing protein [Lacinutrix neustonica]|uniref:DUF3858 domain-containing protein n=1 Tax=Lacinutrix neustonica TaxID=2980107 RepID=A0A9E8MU23_9FLAO|nr:DUF3858 domain-containing protein [Lacinutrix neustonica]WAC01537.1 DUF3858 domain-containing protein [Lacinutrix neustonica]